MSEPAYPEHWEADVVLRDGGTAHLRPIRPDDGDRLRRFYSRLSDETIYFRFFALHRELSDREVEQFSRVDHTDRVALIATVGDEMIGVVRYERESRDVAEVAFNIEDAHQGRGLGSIFLEHVAAAARERGLTRFVADVLPENRRMLRVFAEAGYVVARSVDDGVVRLSFDLEPTEDSLAVTYAREHRAEAASVRRLLQPTSVVVVGAGRSPTSVGRTVLRHLVAGGFSGSVSAVNPHASEVESVATYPSVRDVPGDVDLAVLTVPATEAVDAVTDCVAKGVRSLVVVSTGFAETGEEGAQRQRRLVAVARGGGMRVLGPSSLGVVNTDPAVSLNASLSPVVPARGRVGFFSQSGALGVALLENAVRRGLGLSTFVNAGNRVDVSGNDLMQYWEEDDATEVVMLYLESLGNPRKFRRVAGRLARRKPVIAVKSGGTTAPHGHLVRQSRAPRAAVDAVFRSAGVMRVGSIHEMFDVAQLVAHQPMPAGQRVAVVGNSDALEVLAVDAAAEVGLEVARTRALPPSAGADDFRRELDAAIGDEEVDSVVALFIPAVRSRDAEVAAALGAATKDCGKTVVSCFLGMPGVPSALRIGDGERGSVPSYPTPEDAVRALAALTDYATWRAAPAGHTVVPANLDVRGAREVVARLLGRAETVQLDARDTSTLLACYGIDVWETVPAADAEAAVAAAGRLGYPVALKALAPHLRHRRELGGVRLDIADDDELRADFAGLVARLGDVGPLGVQRMAPTGVACRLAAVEDPLFGPVVSFGIGGAATDLLDDRAYAVPPLTDTELQRLVTSVRAAPLLLGGDGAPAADLAAVRDLLARVGRLADDLPEVATVELNPVVVAPDGATVLSAAVGLARPTGRAERGARALPG